jgi:hypothetical protein
LSLSVYSSNTYFDLASEVKAEGLSLELSEVNSAALVVVNAIIVVEAINISTTVSSVTNILSIRSLNLNDVFKDGSSVSDNTRGSPVDSRDIAVAAGSDRRNTRRRSRSVDLSHGHA